MVMCSNCHKRVAVIFVTKLENGEKTSQGLCIKCAKDMGLPIENMMGDIYNKMGISPDQLEALLREADGSIGRAQKLLDPKKNKSDTRRRELAAKFVEAFATKAPSSDRARLILEFSPKRDDVISELGSVALALRDLIVLKKSEDAPLCFYSDREAAIDLSYRFTIASLLRLYNRVDEASVSLSRNANVRLTLTSLIL